MRNRGGDELAGGGLGTGRVVLHHVELGRFQRGAVQVHGRHAAEVAPGEDADPLARLDDASLRPPELQQVLQSRGVRAAFDDLHLRGAGVEPVHAGQHLPEDVAREGDEYENRGHGLYYTPLRPNMQQVIAYFLLKFFACFL